MPWSETIVPFVFGPTDTLARRGFAPDSLADAARPGLAVAFGAQSPIVDGRLEDWHFARWNDLAGVGSMVRGRESGAENLGARFALSWNEAGIWLAAGVRARTPVADIVPSRRQPAVTLGFASGSSTVQRYWIGGSRRFRVRADGAIEAWTDLRNRRPESFDAVALGVRAATKPRPDGNGFDLELFVPWTTLYPALPGQARALLANLLVEDNDTAAGRLAAWAIHGTGSAARPTWARIDCGPPAAGGKWLASLASANPEIACEWVLVPWGGASSGEIEVRASGPAVSGWKQLRARVRTSGPVLVRLTGLPAPNDRNREARRIVLDWRAPGESTRRTWTVVLPPPLVALQTDAIPPRASFPTPEDVAVRIQKARQRIEAVGPWPERKYHATGILAWRAAEWSRIEELLEQADALRTAAAAGRDLPSARAALTTLWPELGPDLVPRGVALQRATRANIDGSVQPYALFVPRSLTAPAPLLVVLHDLDEDEWDSIQSTSIVAQCARRGWILLCPLGRGNVGYLTVGERDVLQAIAAVRAELPVDGRRIYLTGSGMGGTGTWLLSLRHPDLFAAASIVSGYGDLEQSGIFALLRYQPAERGWYDAHNPVRLLKTGMTTQYRIAHGDRDAVVSPVHARIMHARLEELRVPHAYRLDLEGPHGNRFFDDDLEASLDFMAGKSRPDAGREHAALYAVAGPPMTDVFERGPFVIVYGSRAAASDSTPKLATPGNVASASATPRDRAVAEQLATEWRSRYGGAARVLADTDVTPAVTDSMNLVLIGDPSTNLWLERWRDRLPVRLDADAFVLADKGYPLAKYGIAFAAVSPASPARSVVVLAGMQDRLRLLPNTPFGFAATYAIVNPTQGLIETGEWLPGAKKH